jgi:hypothetical protein
MKEVLKNRLTDRSNKLTKRLLIYDENLTKIELLE